MSLLSVNSVTSVTSVANLLVAGSGGTRLAVAPW